ncbi:hypothetical protein K491DRAFT_43044 [Lophiostoma macrostomum CBS 122681]|uniref:DUF2293 domain-containing protein n=1 Tax=Lophiostoma macrostomum CBS 122681 TaxID=1314788 RepID=A0A6A6SYI3_9PLEO|nr:hypothetical protein K491DRAFT_43044 [Lophiostoma macrostomum CBS 122681]
MSRKREITVSPNKPMQKGYAFLPKGNAYKTLHCRRLTHEAGKPLFVVEDRKKIVGLRVPKHIFFQVQSLARETLADRRAATEKRDNALVRQAEAELAKQFPKIPEVEREAILKHAFRKYSGRVGRTSQTPMSRKVLLAAIAHIRHRHTGYDAMLDRGVDREEARRAIAKKVQDTLRQWGAKGDLSLCEENSSSESTPALSVSENET